MKEALFVLLGIGLSAGAQLLIKHGASAGVGDAAHWFAVLRSVPLVAGVVCYVLAFVLYVYILSVYDVSVASPVMGAGVILAVMAGGALMGEAVTVQRMAGGMLLILGIILIYRSA